MTSGPVKMILASVLLAECLSTQPPPPSMERNTNRPDPNSDYAVVDMSNDPALSGLSREESRTVNCRYLCQKDSRCKAWVLGQTGRCYLKKYAPPAIPEPGCTSGVIPSRLTAHITIISVIVRNNRLVVRMKNDGDGDTFPKGAFIFHCGNPRSAQSWASTVIKAGEEREEDTISADLLCRPVQVTCDINYELRPGDEKGDRAHKSVLIP
jgi:hypothetical protein